MKCLRCGYCCIFYAVVIVDDPEKGIVEDNLKSRGGLNPCQHLLGDKPGGYSCKIHDYSWYSETPCFTHGQIESSPETPCRLGEHILKTGLPHRRYLNVESKLFTFNGKSVDVPNTNPVTPEKPIANFWNALVFDPEIEQHVHDHVKNSGVFTVEELETLSKMGTSDFSSCLTF
jgi:hypothetical protein